MKEDVAGLDFINQLRPVSYAIDNDKYDMFLGIPDSIKTTRIKQKKSPLRQVGFVAQEVEAILKNEGYAFSGVEIPQDEKDPYAIRYAEFVVPLVKAVQELSARVDKLTGQLLEQKETVANENNSGAILYQNAPNPFNTSTEIGMSLPETISQANIIVYTLEGKQLKTIPVQSRGTTAVTIRANELAAGMYFYALHVDGKIVGVKRMFLTDH